MGLLESLLGAAMQTMAPGQGGGAAGQAGANPVAGALMALLTGADQQGMGQQGMGQAAAGQMGAPGGQDDLRPPPGGKGPSIGGGMKDPMPGAPPADTAGGGGGLGALLGGLMGGPMPGAGPMPGNAAMGGGGMGGAMGGGALASGLGALLQQFTQNGFGQQANSWVGTGANMPIDPNALTQAVGHDRLAALAQRYGIPQQELAAALADHLPQAVNELTPQGNVPQPDAMQQMLSQLLGGGRRGGF